jgi:hypothetical protein
VLTSALSHRRPVVLLALCLLLAFSLVPLGAPAADAAAKKPLDIVSITSDPAGADKNSNSWYTKEKVVLKNTGKKTLDLSGYVLKDNGPKRLALPKGTKLKAGKTLTVRTGKGTNTSSVVYWQNKGYVWNNTGDTARLYNKKGKLLESCTYGNAKLRSVPVNAKTKVKKCS